MAAGVRQEPRIGLGIFKFFSVLDFLWRGKTGPQASSLCFDDWRNMASGL